MEDATNVTSSTNSVSGTNSITVVPANSSGILDSTPRAYSRNLLSGTIRGNQNVVGNIYVTSTTSNKQTIALSGATGQINIGADVSSTTTSEIGQGIGIQGASNSISLGISSTSNNAQLLFNDGTNNRLLIGQNANNQEVVWISPSGVEVTTANPNTPGQLIFNSNWNLLQIVDTILTSIPSFAITNDGSNFYLLTVPHGLTYAPLVNIFVPAQLLNFSTGASITLTYVQLPIIGSSANSASYWFPAASGDSYIGTVTYGVDTTNVYIQFAINSNPGESDTINVLPVTILLLAGTATVV